MILTADPRPVWTSDNGTMAQETAKTRWPRIVNDMVEDVQQTVREAELTSVNKEEGVQVISMLESLRDEISGDAPLSPFINPPDSDLQWFNHYIESASKLSWQHAPWLFAECLIYRRVHSILAQSQHWKSYDIFERQKKSTFLQSKTAVQELAGRYLDAAERSKERARSPEQDFALFAEMAQIALWGNATDLSLLSRLSLEELSLLQGREAIEKSQQNIVDNDLAEVWSYLTSAEYSLSDQLVDIVLDNSGFELFTDLVFAAYMLEQGLASKIRLHVKDFPWFVSDAMQSDIEWLRTALASSENFSARRDTDPLCRRFDHLFTSGKIEIVSSWFWTAGSSYYDMPERALPLLTDLRTRDLVIFKGDLHYRKLTNDALWPHTTPFTRALGPLGNESGLKILSLRTNKADVCVGLESEQQLQQLDEICPDRAWVRNGKYAVASFSDGK